ncbi:disintegrin and metalloproteinase domain-containing protein 9-like isoform X1 [Paramormyrops kingsleyae]|uniref:disintegrin and metalloproteinase domain-containing protein 9-like isoform X1 n=1 Tax=Paramormyrops kingsleyae TaxID=1676925 RepID=UPI003B96A360
MGTESLPAYVRVTGIWTLLCGLIFWGGTSSCQPTSQVTGYEVTIPRKVERQRRDTDEAASKQVSYIISIQGKDRVVVLERNEFLVPEDFPVYTYAKDGTVVTERPPMRHHCHYQGYVEDTPGSAVALSICSGLRGVLHVDNSSYGMEPLTNSSSFQHLVYRLQDVPLMCGTPHPDHGHSNATQTQPISQARRSKRAVLHQTHFVELFVVVDNERFTYMTRNQTAVRDEMVQLASYVDSMYVALNIRVVLVGLEIWTQQNLINTEGGAGEVLGRFVQWREQVLGSRRRHDSAQLILKKNFGGTAGMAFVSTVCSRSHGGGINAYFGSDVLSLASIVAHELGHNLGMNHDDGRNCLCDTSSCIMSSGTTGSRNFSSCSSDDFEKLILTSGGSCLLNVPRPDEAYSAPYCGNKLLDVGEECDCGSEKDCEKDPCCEAKTCKLKSGAQCADGVCCKNCKFTPAGSECRSIRDECDLPEFCNGSSPLCQADVFKQNGHLCREGGAYCYNGRCRHYDGQCQAIFGPKAKAAPEVCFRDVNLKGDRFGNCGYQGMGYKKCEIRNAMCGKLQCENVQSVTVFGIEPSIIQTPIAGTKCWGVDFLLGSDVPDPGMVNEGTRCGENKVCLNYQCVSVDELKYDCDIQNTCHGNGVCNSNKNCHCENGWTPPTCEFKGYGGSVDSGPTWNENDTSLRDGLLVFFFVVLPLLGLCLYIFFRRNLLRQRLCRKKSSQAYEAQSEYSATPASVLQCTSTASYLYTNVQDSKEDCGPQMSTSQGPPRTAGSSRVVREGVTQMGSRSAAPFHAAKPPPPPPHPRPAPIPHLVPQRPAPLPPTQWGKEDQWQKNSYDP